MIGIGRLPTHCGDCGARLEGGATIHKRTCRFWVMSYHGQLVKNALREFCNLNGEQLYVRTERGTQCFKDLPYAEREQWIDKWHTEGRYLSLEIAPDAP